MRLVYCNKISEWLNWRWKIRSGSHCKQWFGECFRCCRYS